MPAAVSTRANPPSTENSHAEKRGRQMELAIASFMVSTLLPAGEATGGRHRDLRSGAAKDSIAIADDRRWSGAFERRMAGGEEGNPQESGLPRQTGPH